MNRPWIRLPRALLSGAFFIAYGLFALPFAALLPLPFVPRRLGRLGVRLCYRLFVALAGATGLYRVDARGVQRATGRIVVMNHVSLIDICVLLAHLPDAVCIAKAAAKRNPFLSAVVKKLFIANDAGPERTVDEVSAYLARGVNVVIFPQGTRGGAKFHRGAARLALATRAPVDVYRIDYDPVVLAKGQPWWDVGDRIIRIRLAYRETIVSEGANDHRHAVALTDRLAAALRQRTCPASAGSASGA